MSKRGNFEQYMELKRFFLLIVLLLFSTNVNADLIKPNNELDPYTVVKIQLEALQNNDESDQGIKQTW